MCYAAAMLDNNIPQSSLDFKFLARESGRMARWSLPDWEGGYEGAEMANKMGVYVFWVCLYVCMFTVCFGESSEVRHPVQMQHVQAPGGGRQRRGRDRCASI